MKKTLVVLVSAFMFFIGFQAQKVHAHTGYLERGEVFELLQDAYEVQLSLGEKRRSLDEITDILYPYFSKKYTNHFVEERLFKDVGGWYLPGSDDFYGFIPDFQYDDQTEVAYSANKRVIHVSQFFEANHQGPWTWDSHTETVELTLVNDQTWKITNINGILTGEKRVYLEIDGEKIFPNQPPVMRNNRTLMPLRDVFEKVGAEVEWYGETQEIGINKDDIDVRLQINQETAKKNGEPFTLDSKPILLNNTTMVPVRFITEAIGYDVSWDPDSLTVSIDTGMKGNITKSQAEDLVGKHLKINDDSNIIIEYDHTDETGRFVIHVYTIVQNNGAPGHTATYGWYFVDPSTGEIESMF